MLFYRRCGAVLVASIVAIGSVARAADVPDQPGFDAARKAPPIPVSFLPHEGGWIQFQYPPSARERVAPLISQADDLRAELAEELGQTPLDGVEIRVARGPEEMATLAPQGSPPPPQASSVGYPRIKLIVLSLGQAGATDPTELREGFRRELARLALAEAVSGRVLPAWLVDGFARNFSRESDWARDWALYRASVGRRLRATSELDWMLMRGDSDAVLAAAEAVDFVAFLVKPANRTEFSATIERLRQGDDLDAAVASGYGSSLGVIERHWRAELNRRTTLVTVLTSLGAPALFVLAWALARAARRYRARVADTRLDGKRGPRGGSSDNARVHIVLSRRDERIEPPVITEPEIPKVEHEGEWHTLH